MSLDKLEFCFLAAAGVLLLLFVFLALLIRLSIWAEREKIKTEALRLETKKSARRLVRRIRKDYDLPRINPKSDEPN